MSDIDIAQMEENTRRFVIFLNNVERKKEQIIKKLERTRDVEPALRNLNIMTRLLKHEIHVLKIVRGELDSIGVYRLQLSDNARYQHHFKFLDNIIRQIDRIKDAVNSELSRLEGESKYIDAIFDRLLGKKDRFYFIFGDARAKRQIKKITRNLKRGLRLDEKLAREDVYQILNSFLKLSQNEGRNRMIRAANYFIPKVAAAVVVFAIALGVREASSTMSNSATKNQQVTQQQTKEALQLLKGAQIRMPQATTEPAKITTQPAQAKLNIPAPDYNFSFLISDAEFNAYNFMNQKQIQKFLEDMGSVLKDPVKSEKSVLTPSEVIAKACQKYSINPLIILTKLQVEQSLISASSASQEQLDWALGYGATDRGTISKFKGFEKQINEAAKRLRALFREGEQNKYPFTFTGVNYNGKHGGPKTQVVKNSATYALYRYTPHTYDFYLKKQYKRIGGGNHLFLEVYAKYRKMI